MKIFVKIIIVYIALSFFVSIIPVYSNIAGGIPGCHGIGLRNMVDLFSKNIKYNDYLKTWGLCQYDTPLDHRQIID